MLSIRKIIYCYLLFCMAFCFAFSVRGQITQEKALQVKCEQTTITETTTEATTEQYKPDIESLGTFTLTAYCSCTKCCGKSDGITATGVKVEQGVTIAVDKRVIPYGSKVIINGNTYIAQDTMSQSIKDRYNGKIIDVYFENHSKALEFGKQKCEVFIERG